MNANPTSVEEKIILATIESIEKYGISGATNRQIAQMAGVNIAAINYYFRSKDVLMERVMEITLKNAFDLSDLPPMPDASAQERCTAVLVNLIRGGHAYPGLTRAHFYTLFAEGRPDPLLLEHLNRFIDELTADLRERKGALPLDELKLALTQVVSATVPVILAPTLFEQQQGMNLLNPGTCQAFVSRLVTRLLA